MNLLRLLFLVLFCFSGLLHADPVIDLVPVAGGFSQPLFLTHPPQDDRLFVVEQSGRIRILSGGEVLDPPFLNISSRVTSGGERGLLGLAFHPEYGENGRFFVNYTRTRNGQLETVVAEYRVSASDPDVAETEERILLMLIQPFSNHNAGMIAFGPDEYLYIATGDGGSGGDPFENGQDLSTLLGKILRIDVDGGPPYAVPPDNPFVGVGNARPEIWAYGFRNPWRFSFDRGTGRLFAGDVGQNRWEEIDLVVKGGNYGWNRLEGSHCFSPAEDCDSSGTVLPIAEYGREEGFSVTGGYVYRGTQQTPLWGDYLLADFGSGKIWSLSEGPGGEWRRRELLDSERSIASFGEDSSGELYIVDRAGGGVFRIDFSWREIFPHAGFGASSVGDFRTRIILTNPAEVEISGSLRFFRRNGEALPLSLNGLTQGEFSFVVPAGRSLAFTTDPSEGPLEVGWIEVLSEAPLGGSVLFQLEEGGRLSAEAGIALSDPALQFTGFLQRDLTNGVDSGIAVANPSHSASVDLEVVFISASQGVVGEFATTLGPSEQRAFFPGEVAEVPTDFQGTVRISAGREVAATLLTTLGGIHSASLPLE